MTTTEAYNVLDAGRLRVAGVGCVELRPEMTSTNDVALKMCRCADLATPALVAATRQTAGRGRGSNRWWATEGALTFSLILSADDLAVPADRWPQISLATAVAIVDTLQPRVGSAKLGVKWPNDVYADGRKLAGILVEIPANPISPRRMVIGVGINVNNSRHSAPPEVGAIAAALIDLSGGPHDLSALLGEVVERILTRIEDLRRAPAKLASTWQALCVLRERRVEIDTGSRTVAGRCLGIGNDGGLLIDDGTAVVRLYGGIVRSIGL